MSEIDWCKKQPRGISIVTPDIALSKQYLERAKLDLRNIGKCDDVWNTIISYYSCYHAVYAVLLRYGIICQIHTCTILLTNLFKELEDKTQFLKNLKENRINTQYYLKLPENIKYAEIQNIINICETIITECNTDKIKELHKKLQ